MDQEKQQLLDEYNSDIQWLRDHVALDDVYDFAQQCLMSSNYFLYRLSTFMDIGEEVKNDPALRNKVKSLLALQLMKKTGSTEMINTEIIIQLDEDNNPG